jgi:hypothetical protein
MGVAIFEVKPVPGAADYLICPGTVASLHEKTMNPVLSLIILSLAWPLLTNADVIVYRESETARVTVAGRTVTVPVMTYVVHDLNSGEFSAIGLLRIGANKYYGITNNTGHRITRGIAGPMGNYMVLSKVLDSNDSPDVIVSSYFARGRETTLDLGNGNTASFPRSMKATSRSVSSSGGHLAIFEGSAAVVFQATETKTANTAGENVAAVIERLRLRFEAQGYVPAPE